MRIVFFGTPEFAIPSLEAVAREHEVVAVVTQEDRPRGRGRKLAPPPVKVRANELGLPVLQPKRIRKNEEFLDTLRKFEPDYFVVVAYGKILPPQLLAIPRFGSLNVHPSLLPKYRGAAPVNWAIINGEKVTGVTIMELDEGMDTGPVVLQRTLEIPEEATAGEMLDLTARVGAEMLCEVLRREEETGQRLPRRPQQGEPSYAPMLEPSVGAIDWSAPAPVVANLARGVDPRPGAYAFHDGRRIKLFKPRVMDLSGRPGEVLGLHDGRLVVACGQGAVGFMEVQPEGRRRMQATALWAGRHLAKGDVLSGGR